MAGTRLTENPSVHALFSLLEEIRGGGIRLPKFQRPFVWDDQQRVDLLDSVVRGLPVGSILVWRTANPKLPTFENLGGWRVAKEQSGATRSLIIDGHQRLMTLLSAFYAPDEPPEGLSPMYYDLKAECFKVAEPSAAAWVRPEVPEWWVSLTQLRTNSLLIGVQRKLMEGGHSQLADRAEALRNAFVEYRLPVVPMVSDDFREVAIAFQRINRGSSPMGEVHMVHALVAAGDIDLVEALEERRYDLQVGWRELDQQTWLMLIKLSSGRSAYDKDAEWLAETILSDPAVVTRVTRQLVHAVDFLQTVGVFALDQLPYAFQLIFIAHGFGSGRQGRAAPEREVLGRWFWWSSLTGLFGGISEGKLKRALQTFEALLDVPGAELGGPSVVEGPVSPKRASARLRSLKAYLRMMERSNPEDFVDEWRRELDGPRRQEAIDAERDCAALAGLPYAVLEEPRLA